MNSRPKYLVSRILLVVLAQYRVGFEHRVVQVSRILPDLLALEGVVEQLLDERAVRYTLVDLHGSFLAEVRKVERRSVKIGIEEPQYMVKGSRVLR